jgi:hypothetical protein
VRGHLGLRRRRVHATALRVQPQSYGVAIEAPDDIDPADPAADVHPPAEPSAHAYPDHFARTLFDPKRSPNTSSHHAAAREG